MNNALKLLTSISEELLRVVETGYDQVLYYHDGFVFNEAGSEGRLTNSFNITGIRTCQAIQGIIYKVDLSNGSKGFFVIPWKDQDNDE